MYKKIISAILILTLAISLSACAKDMKGGSSSSDDGGEVVISDRTPLLNKISDNKLLVYGDENEQSRKYLKGALDNAQRAYDNEECTDEDMNNAIADIDYAVSILKEGTFNPVAIPGLSAYKTAEKATAPDGTENALKFSGSFGGAGTESPFGGALADADGIIMHFCADAAADSMSVTLAAGATAFTAVLPQPAAKVLRISFDYFINSDGLFIEDYLSAMDSFKIEATGVCYVADLGAYAEVIEKNKTALSVHNASSISNDKFYKIYESKSGKVLTYGPELTERETLWNEQLVIQGSDQRITFTDENDSITQLWQLFKCSSGNYRLINKGTGTAITTDVNMNISMQPIDMTSAKQEFGIKSKGNGEFLIDYVGAYSLTSLSSKVYLKSGTNYTVKIKEYDYGDWQLIKEDNFDGDTLDRTLWTPDNAKNRGDTEPMFYRDSEKNHWVKDGNLVIKSIVEEYKGYHATSASISTAGKYAISYGKVDVRCKVPAGKHIWPAIWMMGSELMWPHDGEIDIMETGWMTDTPESEANAKNLNGTLHWFGDEGCHMSKNYNFPLNRESLLSDDYHVYSLEWDEEQIRLYVDGMMYYSLIINSDSMKWGFGDQPHYLILNTSISGPGNDQLPEGLPQTSEYYIDYVRFYKRSGEVSNTEKIANNESLLKTTSLAGDRTNVIKTTPDGKYTIACGWTSTIYVYNAKKATKKYEIDAGDVQVFTAMDVSPDSKSAACGARDGSFTIVDLTDGTATTMKNSNVYYDSVMYSKDGSKIFAGGRNYDTMSEMTRFLYVYDASGLMLDMIELDSDIRNMAVSDKYVALAQGNSNVKLYNVSDYSLAATLKGHTSAVRGIDFSTDGSRLVSSDENGNIIVWDVASQKQLRKMNNTCNASVCQVKFVEGGRRVVAASNSGDVRIFTVANGRLYSLLGGFASLVRDITISNSGKMMAACSFDGQVKTFRPDGTLLETANVAGTEGNWVEAMAFGKDTLLYFGKPAPYGGLFGSKLRKK